MMRVAGIVLFMLLGLASAMAQKDKRAEAILEAMSARYKALTSYQATFSYAAGGDTYQGDLAVKGPMFRLKTAGQEVFTDGKVMSTYVRDAKEVTIQDYDADAQGDFNPANVHTLYKKGFGYTYLREQKTGGRTLDVIELKPDRKNGPFASVQLSIDRADKSLRSWQLTDKSGKKTSYTISRFVPNPNLAASYFVFDKSKYPGVEVVDLR